MGDRWERIDRQCILNFQKYRIQNTSS